MRAVLAGVFACALSVLPVAAAEFAASYSVEGVSPGESEKYTGTVTIKKTADAIYQINWTIAGDKFVGTGIGSPEGLAVSYKSGADTGVAIYSEEKGGVITGFWTYAGGKAVGQEKWTPK